MSCKSNISLDGTWVESYSKWIDDEGVAQLSATNGGNIYTFKNDSVHIKNFFANQLIKEADTVVTYTLKNGNIHFGTIEKISTPLAVTKDSIVFTIVGNKTYTVVCKKLPASAKAIQWNPKGKQYKVSYKESQGYYDFVNDSTAYYFNDVMGDFIEKTWNLERINNHTLLVLKSYADFEVEYVLIDSLSGKNVYTKNYQYTERPIVFEEQEIAHSKPSSLFGTWKLVSKEALDSDMEDVSLPATLNDMETMHIYKDSIVIIQPPFRPSQPWKYYKNAATIVLNDSKRAIKISSVSQDSLVLSMNLSSFEFDNRKFTFVRE